LSEKTQLPDEVSLKPLRNPAAQASYQPISSMQEFEAEPSAVPLSHYLWILRRHLWKMVGFVVACMLTTFVFSARQTPIYESTATIDVDLQAPSEAVGQNSTRSTDTDDPDIFFATQIRLIQSDAVLRPVAEQFHLLNQEGRQNTLSTEQAQNAAEAPVSLSGLTVTRPSNTYLLLISYRSQDSRVAADIVNAVANSYLMHTYDIRIRSSEGLSSFMEKHLDELKAKMERSTLALAQSEKDQEVVDPEEKTNMLSARLLQLNTEYTTAQAERVRAEATWNAMKSGSVEAAEVSSQGESLARLAEARNQARLRLAEVKSTYGANHPEYRKASTQLAEVEKEFDDSRRDIGERIAVAYRESLDREQMLKGAVAKTKAESDRLNARSFEYQHLKQEANADKALYDELIKKISEANINAGFQNNHIRIADVARPSLEPVSPNTRQNLLIAFLFSVLLSVGAALVQDSLDTTLRDPEEASRFLGTDVIGTLPLDRNVSQLPDTATSEPEETLTVKASLSGNGNGNHRKGYYRSISGFEEAVRTIRNTIFLGDFEQQLHSLVLTSAEPGEGKTTLAAHLAIANAARGKSTLLVDGDLRRPGLNARFGLNPREGLSNVLTGELHWQDVVLPIEGRPNLSLLPSGPGSHRAADLVGQKLSALLDEFAKEYDLVILDSPPLLGFAECLQMATAADGVLIISRAGETKRKAVATVVSTLLRLRANVVGVVLNQVSPNTSADGYAYYGHYRYGHYRKSEQ
jgi:succinoglycan biosynthesis transport protein ExoP